MTTIVEKIAVLAKTVEEWRHHYRINSIMHAADNGEEIKASSLDRKRVALGCLAASLLLHDRAVIELETRREKIRQDFRKGGMILPGHRLTFIGDRPVAIER